MDISELKRLYFIHHSTYLFRTESCWMLFDYYTQSEKILEHLADAPTLPLYVFCSHSHGDHYSSDVFTVLDGHIGSVHYIFHDEVRAKVSTQYVGEVHFLQTGDEYSTSLFSVKAYGSTDSGGSFFITLEDGFTLFYAGDLNFWHWNQEADEAYINLYRQQWETELSRITADRPSVDLLMFPTDLRLGPDYLMGLRQFIQAVPTIMLAPMHLNGTLSDVSELTHLDLRLLTDSLL